MTKSISCLYTTEDQLKGFIEMNGLRAFSTILVQVFSGISKKKKIIEVQGALQALLPNASVIGSTTEGEICKGQLLDHQIVVSFTIFEKVELQSTLLHLDIFSQDSFLMGKSLANRIASDSTKAIILFCSSLEVNIQELLRGINTEFPRVIIVGGISANQEVTEDESLVFTGEEMTAKGIVAVALEGSNLTVENYTSFGWQEIGQPIKVTKSIGATILEIDHKKPITVLRQYLGELFIDMLPESGVEFPFILEENGEKVSVFISKVNKNGTIEVNRPIEKDQIMTFAYVSKEEIINKSLKRLKQLARKPMETIFVYKSRARKRIMEDFTIKEMEMLNHISPVNGFFSYGEIYSQNGEAPQIINHSLSYLALSECSNTLDPVQTQFHYKYTSELNTIITLTHLMQKSQKEVRNLNENLLTSEQYYRSLFDNNTEIVYSTDLRGCFTSVNLAFENAFGFKREELISKSSLRFIKEQDIPRVKSYFYRALRGKEQYYNIEIPDKQGKNQLFQIKNIPITVNNEPVGIYGIARNITEKQKFEERITQLAYFDHETQLPNRMKLTEILDEMLQRAKKKKRMLAVLSIDFDRFKMINNSLGHYAGDTILGDLVGRLKKSLPSGAYLGRFGGDKFTLVLTKEVQPETVLDVANTIQKEIYKPIFYLNQEYYVTASIGVSLYPNDGTDERLLLKNADIAMNLSKHQGGNQVIFFSTEMNEQALIRFELESYLRKALMKNEFFLVFQPLVDLASGETYGSEALIRWNHPKLGLVSPADFIPLAEETGLIKEIGNWVLYTACAQNKKWQRDGLGMMTVAVNVSVEQFQQVNFVNDVKDALNVSGLAPEYLTLELTESIMLRNIDNSIQVMKSLQSLGVKVSIDDFGTGYSSLSYLRNLPINKLKIDRSFINNLHDNSSDIAIVKAIIMMGHGLDIKVVAEGVETKEQIELLKALKCHYAQGFYIHRPLTTEQFEYDMQKLKQE
jgi:diguanylate cyclase (GGDEF)-like protein/PAS domain S-box-containing protein